MKPAGEVRLALLQACRDLQQPGRGPTLREMAHHARVGIKAAKDTVRNMRRDGVLVAPRTRHVDYRNRPVNEYALAKRLERRNHDEPSLDGVMMAWAG